ncbi:MAG TPA: CoA transferase, partial [Pseudolabrys sp.]|nr:CoA transferase [Pseudolabrys sp.]
MTGSLDGVRVLELARYQAGPRGGMILCDLGAEVIKIEKLGGEETRRSEPLVKGQSVYFSVYNRGKKSLCLDMRTQRGKEIFAALVPKSDIVLQNFRPGVMEKMGFGYDELCKLKRDIILVSVSGFGQYGPYRERPAFDPLGQAMSGLMSLTGKPVGTPLGAATSLVDRYTSLHATIGALAALHHRDKTGEGQVVDCCLLDSGFTMVEIPLSYYLATGEEGGEGGRPPYKAKDGHVVISASGREMASRLMRIVSGDAAASAEGFTSRVKEGDARRQAVTQWCAGHTVAEIVET